MSNRTGIMRTKSVQQSIADTEDPEHALKKNLGALDLVVFGVGVIIGAGIFVLTGQVAAESAGPAVALSFLIAAIACGFAALCYAEFASTVPVAGSAYTFSYATVGEFVAWIIGWDLVLEFTLGSAALASGFSQYLTVVLDGTPFLLPEALRTAPPAGIVDLPAIVISLLVMAVLISGIKFSSMFNQVVTAIKLAVVAIVVVAGIGYVSTSNWAPFVPPSQPTPAEDTSWLYQPLIQLILGIEPATYGFLGVIAGASLVFFAFIGFDVVATTAEEARNPQKDVPIGILGSLAVVTVLYMIVSLIITGMRSYEDIDPADGAPLATAFDAVGLEWVGTVIAIGACIGLIVVVMILMLGQTRVAFAMSRDGLLPLSLARTHPRFRTPHRITAITGVAVAAISGFVPLGELAKLVNIGTLFAFTLVSIGVVVLRRTQPDLPRAFRVPAVGVVATIAVVLCFYLMLNLEAETWIRFGVWMVLGVVVYFVYSRQHSRLGLEGRGERGGADRDQTPPVAR